MKIIKADKFRSKPLAINKSHDMVRVIMDVTLREYRELQKVAANNKDWEKPNLSTCPGCGGDADNGHDRCVPPSPYYCTKCDNPPIRKVEEF